MFRMYTLFLFENDFTKLIKHTEKELKCKYISYSCTIQVFIAVCGHRMLQRFATHI